MNRKPRLHPALGLILCATVCYADDLVSPDDALLRHHVSLLVDSRAISLPVTTWPLNAAALERQLDRIEEPSLTAAQADSYDYLLRFLGQKGDPSLDLTAGSDATPIRGFGNTHRSAAELRVHLRTSGERFAAQLQPSLTGGDGDALQARLDNSYLAADWGNWQFGAGNIDRWWGPGWQSSLILSSNARPTPGLFVSRRSPKQTDLPILRQIGPWTFTAFANQLESERHIPNAKLLGARFAAKPIPALELGFSRAAQWGGEGRPQTFGSLVDLLIGNDNVGDDGIALDGANEPGNQLGGIDWRWSASILDQPLAFYGQIIGEDEAGGLPSRNFGLLGIESPVAFANTHGRVYFEVADTTMSSLKNRMPNSTYNHHIYRTGYRYKSEPIGASFDNDARVFTLGGIHSLDTDQSLSWKALYAQLNRDGVAANNALSSVRSDIAMLSAEYTTEVTENASLNLSAYHVFGDTNTVSNLSENGVQARVTLRL